MTRSPDSRSLDPQRPDAQEPNPSPSFAARLKQKYGEGVDPEISLDAAPSAPDPAAASATSELVKRLAEHSLKESRYKLEGEVARGGMGAILKIWDADLRRHLAMKVILGRGEAPSAGGTPQVEAHQLARFLEEAQVTGQLDHPGIVPVHELGLDQDGRVYFTMKLVKGRDLKHIFDLVFAGDAQWTETRVLGDLLKVCEAMAYAHAKKVIHRDLKPGNVMVGNFGEVYVMDWGLARVLEREDRHDIRIAPEFSTSLASVKTERRDEREDLSDSPVVTMDGDVVGTPAYMPPEQARGEIDKLSPRADVYAIGAMLYHLLARRAPYTVPGARVSNRTVLGMVLQGPPTPLETLRHDVPAELGAIVEKAMARETSARYADTLALAEDLRAYLEHRVVSAYETGAWAETRKWVERNKPLAASLAAGVLVLAVGLASTAALYSKADKKEKEASANAITAKANEERANDQAKIATQKTNDVLSLSAIQELKEQADDADKLWPAHPENLAAYEAWLAKAKLLIGGRAQDEGPGKPVHPSLKDHERKLAELRLRAKPLTSEQVEADRKANASFAQAEQARAHLIWLRRMLGDEAWPSAAEVEAALAKETLPADANGLNSLAWPLADVDPAKIVYGSEVKALVLAQRAVLAAKDAERAGIRDTLGWALYRCGRFEAALVEEQRAVDEAKDQQKQELAASLKQLQDQVSLWTTGAAHTKQAGEASKLSARVADLERDVSERRTYEFDDAEDRWWHTQLAGLVTDLKAFTDEKSGGLYSSGTSEKHGWGIVKRAEFARTIEERSVIGAEAKRRWDEAIAAIVKSSKYGGLALTPQLGLLPIGEDPDSHLWEFAHLQTGDPAQRGTDRRLILKPEMGLVFVLIPAGRFKLGAQSTDPTGDNYDPGALGNESPYQVALDAYFLSKYEMTQGQWERFVGRNPSNFGPRNYSPSWNRAGKAWNALHPVEEVSWNDCDEMSRRLGLALPTEAQWEHGCRGSTSTVYWSGDDAASLADAGNVADQYAKDHGGGAWPVHEAWDDGNLAPAEIGSYRANDLGLHDTHGNVWEWCRDWYGTTASFAPGDGERQVEGSASRVDRGGSFGIAASNARSAYRDRATPEGRANFLGLRPARAFLLSASLLHPPVK